MKENLDDSVDNDILIYWRSKWFIWKYTGTNVELNASNAKFAGDVLVDSPLKLVGTGYFKPLA